MNPRSFTYHDLVCRNASLHADRTAFILGDERCTHAEYAQRVQRLASGLARQGIGTGDRIAALLANGMEFVDLLGAAARLGAIVVPINARLSADEVDHVMRDTGPRMIIVSPEFDALLPSPLPGGCVAYTAGEKDDERESMHSLYEADRAAPIADVDDDAAFLVIHTAAVGGRARGAVLSHRSLLAASLYTGGAWKLTQSDVHVGVLPLFHLAGIGLLLAVQHAGGATALVRGFDPDALVDEILRTSGSVLGSFPPMLAALTDACVTRGESLASLRIVTGIDAPETIERFQRCCRNAKFWAGYGQTETSGIVSMAPFDERPGSAGRPIPLNAIAILDDEGQALPAGEEGEIALRGPMVFSGYWGVPEAEQVSYRAGWHHTGDLGRLDSDGFLWYAGRSPAKELIKPGGENVYPAEVERCLREHPDIAEAVVFGVPDEQWGEAVMAVCVAREASTPSVNEVSEFAASRIARYKRPKRIVFVDSLPRTSAQAIDRAAVKAAHAVDRS
ncbi:MAG: AMP-binding protein [Burkholderiaceae bacterium]|nr:AMP-binding protein [Burkholderiaceae bacterium]